MNRQRLIVRLAIVSASLVGCGRTPGTDDLERVEQPHIIGTRVVTSSTAPMAGETSALVNQNGSTFHTVVAFNWADPANINYDPIGRVTFPGASFTGWSWSSTADGRSAFAAPQRLVPTPEWPILWGDPAIGQIPSTGYVYISTIAVPSGKVPQQGYIDDTDRSYVMENYLGGACIARSSNGGQTFSVSSNDCLHDANYSFYDGSDIVGASGNRVFAAFSNSPNHRIDVWMASSATGSFTLLPDPFPTVSITSHPRLYAFGTGVVLVAASTRFIYLQTYNPTTGWQASAGWPLLVTSTYDSSDVNVGGVSIRRGEGGGAQFSVINYSEYSAPYTIFEVPYTASSAGHSIMRIAFCQFKSGFSPSCSDRWTVDPGTNVFHPTMVHAQINPPPPNPVYTDVSVVSWLQQSGNQVRVMSQNVVGLAPGAIAGRPETGLETPCPTGRGFWGDYDNHLGVYQSSGTAHPNIWRSFTDSTDGNGNSSCTQVWTYLASTMAVSAVNMLY